MNYELSVPNPHSVKNRYQILISVKNWYQIITCETLVSKLTCAKNWYLTITHMKKLVPKYHLYMKNWYLIFTDVSDKTVKNWNRVQNAAALVVFYYYEEYGCLLYET